MTEIQLASKEPHKTPSNLPKSWRIHDTTLREMLTSHEAPPIAVFYAHRPDDLKRSLSKQLDRWLEAKPLERRLVLVFDSKKQILTDVRIALLRPFTHPERVDVSENFNALPSIVENITAKLQLRTPALQNPLDRIREIISINQDLRSDCGNLSADKMAHLFGFSTNEFASILGRSRQSISKTPDADSLQPDLNKFDRIARIRSVLENDSEFRKWLRTPQDQLENEPPLQWINQKHWDKLVEYIENILTGSPG